MRDLLRPFYNGGPIRDLAILYRVIGLSGNELDKLTLRIQDHYRPVSLLKPDGTVRICWNPSKTLRRVQGRLVTQFLRKVNYPLYLHGSLPGRSYISNAKDHKGSKWCASLDVKSFFPSISATLVRDEIWAKFFGFSPDVAQHIADITTLNKQIPQGSLTASYLANLCLWRDEGNLVRKLNALGFRYSRYVDDIAISAPQYPIQDVKTKAIALIHATLKKSELDLKREKTTVMTVGKGISIVGLSVGQEVGRSKKQREQIARAVIDFPGVAAAMSGIEADKLEASIRGQLAEMRRYHAREADRLVGVLEAVKQGFETTN